MRQDRRSSSRNLYLGAAIQNRADWHVAAQSGECVKIGGSSSRNLYKGSRAPIESKTRCWVGKAGMRQRDLTLFRKILEERKRELLQEAERAVGTMNHESEEAFATQLTGRRWNRIEISCSGCATASAG